MALEDVIIIGAGPAGLAVGACLRRKAIPFLMLEQAADVGSRWRGHYDRLHLHTTKQFSALPYMPFPANYPTYPSRQQVVDYLTAYAAQFQIEPRFNQSVTAITRVDDSWEVQTADSSYPAKAVVIATGLNQTPYLPSWPGQDRFQGKILHSSQYKNADSFRGQKVLVVGFGNSGAEIAVDLHEQGAIPSLAVRSAVNVITRDVLGIPSQWLSILLNPLPPRLIDTVQIPILKLRFGNLPNYGLKKLPYGAIVQMKKHRHIPVIDIGVMKLIRQKQVIVHPGIEQFTDTGVIFTDGIKENFDAIILATGYRTGLDTILPYDTALLDDQGYPLTSGKPTAAPRLYFCGFRNSSTGLLYTIAGEAKQIASLISTNSEVL